MESHLHWSLIAIWASLALLTFAMVDASAAGGWFALLAVFAIPPMLLLRLWSGGPPEKAVAISRSTGAPR
jgi:hypothetical protein